MEDVGYIYVITNKKNGKQYVGQTNNPKRRWAEHKATGNTGHFKYASYLYNAMQQDGIDSFDFNILETVPIEQICEKEVFWISKLNTIVPNGYNILVGGVALYGEHNPFYGKHHTEETKQLISSKNQGRPISEREREIRRKCNAGERNPFYGKQHTEETKIKIKNTNIQRGHYQAFSERMQGNQLYCYRKYKSVAMIDPKTNQVIRVFKNAMEAGEYIKELGLSKAKTPSNIITGVCNGHERIGAGYIWRYIETDAQENESQNK